jgi:HSP20 family molecular chaperone IbpA
VECIVYSAKVRDGSAELPLEFAETADHFYLVLEIPGTQAAGDVDVRCEVAADGYIVSVEGTRKSAIDAPAVEEPRCTRPLGALKWSCELRGVYERQPQLNCHDGLVKLRFRKRQTLEETFSAVAAF